MIKRPENMKREELEGEVERIKNNLCDLEEIHSFTFGKTTVHIGVAKAQNMQLEFEEECRKYNEQISAIENALKTRDAR